MQLLQHVGLSLWTLPIRHSVTIARKANCSTSVTCWKCAQNLSVSLGNSKDIMKMYFCGCEDNVILPPVTDDYFTLLAW